MMPKRRTTLNLDSDLVDEARRVLGTTGITETIHLALQEAINRGKRLRLLDMGMGELSPERLQAQRRNRSFEGAGTLQPA